MILRRLFELAEREKLLEDPAFVDEPIPYVIVLGAQGDFLGVSTRREMVEVRGKKGAPSTKKPGGGIRRSTPRAHGNTANKGFARYLADTLPRVTPFTVEEKDKAKAAASRQTFWAQMKRVAEETKDPAMLAAVRFGEQLNSDPALAARVVEELVANNGQATDRCTLEYLPHGGPTILEHEPLRAWYRQFYRATREEKASDAPVGVCQVTGEIGPIPRTHDLKLSGIPGGLSTGVSVISFDKPAFQSYSLEGAANASLGERATEGYSQALRKLIREELPGQPRSQLRIGETLFLYWTRQAGGTDMSVLFESPTPASVAALFDAPRAGQAGQAVLESDAFYLLALTGNSARAIVRDYLERPLVEVIANVAQWFRDLTIAVATRDGVGKPDCVFPLWMLATATALDSKQVAQETPVRLLMAAVKNEPVGWHLLAACLQRLRAEGSEGFRPARLALIKLILKRGGTPVSETLDAEERHPAYVYGRLLSVFEQVQYAALGSVNATVVDKFYGTFSAAPALVFARLFSGAQNHLRKVRGENRKKAIRLEKHLQKVCKLLPASAPRGQLSLQDQGRFALGYYHEKARRFEEIAERKASQAKNEP